MGLMFDLLARLADRRARRIGLLAIGFFLLAGAAGGSVADRLDPYGADDPATESVQAKNQLNDAGLRVPGVIVVLDHAPVSSPATRARVARLERELGRRDDVQSVSSFYNTRSTDFVSNDRRSTYVSVALTPTDDKAWQESGAEIAEQLEGRPGITVGGAAVAQQQVNDQVEKDLRRAEMLAFPLLLPALAPLLPQPRRGTAAGDGRAAGDRRNLPGPEDRQRIRLDLDLRPQPDDRARARAGDRLQPLHRLPISRGDRQGRTGVGGDAPGDGDRRPDSLLLLDDGRGGPRGAARLPPALPLLDGPRRLPGGAARGADLADRAAGGPDPARDPGQLPRAAVPAAARRRRHPPRRERVLVPPLAPRDAPADPDRDAFRRLPDPPRPSLLLDQVQHRRPDRAAEERQRPPGLRHGQRAVPALPRDADLGLGRRRDTARARSRWRRGSAVPKESPRPFPRAGSKTASP